MLRPRYSRVGGGRDPHDQEVVFLAEEPPQPLVVPADVQVPDVEALGGRGGKEKHQGLGTDATLRCPPAREEPPPRPHQEAAGREGQLSQGNTPPPQEKQPGVF